ncbi:PucR family transcriptional regulator [Clostridium sp. C105KSO13]|uniref:PucR family transcriptional regulator n=1 Tax=Clostridium sp. C105KSO13 TaxID=1776045 RepID=UPI0007406A3D|nr:helix-turn-helix domain-containing protein [Clostridium sp. C105KSO13]CUX18814.1 Purine catabolism regulatory protein [Clostridium sp. C105KSO13]
MEYHILLNRLRKNGWHPQIFGQLNSNNDLINIRILVKKQKRFEPSTLYLTSTELMPSPKAESIFTLFCYGKPIDFSIYQESAFNITYFGEDVSPDALFNTSLENLTELHQVTSGMHILLNALFSGNGLQYLVDTASHLFENPIYVVDLQNKYLAISSGIVPDNKFFSVESASGYISEAGIQSIRANNLDEKVRMNKGAYYYVNELVNKGMLVDAIHIQGIEVGHVMMMEYEHPFREFDSDFFHRFCELVSIEMQKDPAYASNKGVMYSYFLSDLLKNPEENIVQVSERLTSLGYDLKEYLYILAIPSTSYHLSNTRLDVITNHLRTILTGSIYAVYEDSIVFLISKKRYSGLSEYELTRLTDFLSANDLKAGFSNFFESLKDAPRFYKQALKAVSLGTKLNDASPLCYYSDYYMYEMLELYEKSDTEIRFLIHPGLMQLYYYDQEKNSDLVRTLKDYLEFPGQPAKVAANLHIHKNTLLYRMGKIKEITGCQFKCGGDYMNFNFSFNIMEYLKMI